MASRISEDWDVLEIDAVREIDGRAVVRKFDRKLAEFTVSRVAFFRALLVMVECLIPNCNGHQKYGVVVDENVPVVFRRHEQGQQAVYAAYKNPISKPMRVPENGDYLLSGIKWRATEFSLLVDTVTAITCIFDCLIADLRFRMMTPEFCLECLFAHTNGRGLILERFLKTVLYHIVPFGRVKEKQQFIPLRVYWDRDLDMKFKRIYWGQKAFKIFCDPVRLNEQCGMGSPEKPISGMANLFDGFLANPQTSFLRNLDSITKIIALVKCHCMEKVKAIEVYCGLISKLRAPKGQAPEFMIVLANWNLDGKEYEDPLWNYSMTGNGDVALFVCLSAKTPSPIARWCEGCKNFVNMIDVQIPETTWLFCADLTEPLQRCSVQSLQGITAFQIGGVAFVPAFVLVYNTENGRFSTINLIKKNEWRFFDDYCGGLFKRCNPDRVKYTNKINLRVYFYRKTEVNPHACLARAAANQFAQRKEVIYSKRK